VIRRIIKRGLIGLVVSLLIAASSLLTWRAVRQQQAAAAIRIPLPAGIDLLEKVKLGGVEPVDYGRGHDRAQPLLLFLHGGPGLPEMPFAHVNAELEKHFVVVEWDQRGAGKSFSSRIPPETMTIAQFVADAEELVELLSRRFQQEGIFLLGHSSGSVIGALLAARRPELVRAYIGLAPVADLQETERLLYDYATRSATAKADREAQRELAAIGPPPFTNAKQLQISQMWVNHFATAEFGKARPNRLTLAVFSPRTSLLDYWRTVRGAKFSFDHLWRELFAVNLFEQVKRLEMPVYFLLGRQDRVVTGEVAERYFQRLQAPQGKQLLWFEKSGHWPQLEEPEKFHRVLVDHILKANPLPERNRQQAMHRLN
jgi:pimeloyl-ACP methyl ester carboxylesterase